MTLVLTVLARDEADIIDAQIAFHLSAGVDFVIATDNRSRDGTTEILESYERAGVLHLIHEPAEGLRQSEWVTRMARLAVKRYGAEWVINSDADEFWWPRDASLRDVFAAVPRRYGIVRAFWRSFVPRPDDRDFFAERMTARLAQEAPINDPTSFYRPVMKIAHRGDPQVVVGRGNHGLVGSSLSAFHTWHPVEVLHFPLRSGAQWMRKVELQGEAFTKYIERTGTGYHLKSYDALLSGQIAQQHKSMVIDDDTLDRGLAAGTLVLDVRLRDVLRSLRTEPPSDPGRRFALPTEGAALPFPPPSASADASYAVEAAALGEANTVRLQRQLDRLERRVRSLEARSGAA